MEVFRTDSCYIFTKDGKSLWWNRLSGEFSIKSEWDLSSVDDIECVGVTPGIIGRLSLSGVYEPHLMVVKESVSIGVLYAPHTVYKVKSICLLGSDETEDILQPCARHNSGSKSTPTKSANNTNTAGKGLFEGSVLVTRTWGAVKSAGSTIKNSTQHAAAMASSQVKSSVGGRKDPGRIEKRVTEELHKIFDDTDSFYYSLGGDMTCNLQRQEEGKTDDRFFWNKYMIEDIIKLNDPCWILPVIQGFVQIESCCVRPSEETFSLALVSRRSRFRAGTRYKRRGVDEFGYVANYVETEQILSLEQHQMSFTMVRGSVPVFWSQPGYKYRPPPRIDRGEAETQLAFEKHFDQEISIYGPVCIVNLVEQTGKEGIIWEAFNNCTLSYNNPQLTYVTFDFHQYCRGMHFENVSVLLNVLVEEISDMGFCWRDSRGVICKQRAVFRVNCMDCLDRTNVVQTALGKAVLESQLSKLGMIPPRAPFPAPLRAPFQRLWANNGDIISRQYAGTNALKGDYTRTGERKISGMMKDGMNSANRYFIQHFFDAFRQCCIDLCQGNLTDDSELKECLKLDQTINTLCGIIADMAPDKPPSYYNHGALALEFNMADALYQLSRYYLSRFKDSYRQATIDLMLGNQVSAESLMTLGGEGGTADSDGEAAVDHARMLVEDCRRLLLGDSQLPLGAWGLIDANPSTGDPNETEVDCILLLTSEFYLVAEYDLHLDKVTRFEKVPLSALTLIELGSAPPRGGMGALGGRAGVFKPGPMCLRLNYTLEGVTGYYHMFRSPNLRFFNNVAVVIKTKEEVVESLMAISESIVVALQAGGLPPVPVLSGGILERRTAPCSSLTLPGTNAMPRNLSESQLLSLGSKAFSNMSEQFSKLGQTLSAKKLKKKSSSRPRFSVGTINLPQTESLGKKLDYEDTSSDSESDNNIFEPNASMKQDGAAYENTFLPSVGIVMGGDNSNILEHQDSVIQKHSSDVSNFTLGKVMENVTINGALYEASEISSDGMSTSSGLNRYPTPEITIFDDKSDSAQNSLKMNQKFSRSTGEVDTNILRTQVNENNTANRSEKDLSLTLSGSQSENALKLLTSPISGGLSRLAKGVQNFGANLDPRKITVKGVPNILQDHQITDEHKRLVERWSDCKTKLIAL